MATDEVQPTGAVTFAADLQCGEFGNFRTELYEFQSSQTRAGGGRRFWHFRWLLDFLGGTPVRNFVSASADSFGNKIQERLTPIYTEDARAESRRHLLTSSWARLKRRSFTPRKRKAETEDEEDTAAASTTQDSQEQPGASADASVPEVVDLEELDTHVQQQATRGTPLACREFAVSTFGLLVLLAGWAFRMRANMKWTLPSNEVQKRAKALLRSLADTFLTADVEACSTEQLPFHLSFAGPRLGLRALLESPGGRNLAGIVSMSAKGVNDVHIAEICEQLAEDENDRNLGSARRQVSRELFSRLLEHWASTVDSGERTCNLAWTSTNVRQLQQLRSRPYCVHKGSSVFVIYVLIDDAIWRRTSQDSSWLPSTVSRVPGIHDFIDGQRRAHSYRSCARSGTLCRPVQRGCQLREEQLICLSSALRHGRALRLHAGWKRGVHQCAGAHGGRRRSSRRVGRLAQRLRLRSQRRACVHLPSASLLFARARVLQATGSVRLQ